MQGEAYATNRPGQDEKFEIYRKHHGLMDAAFDRAREFRKNLHNEYDDRNCEISEKLDSIKQRTDGEAKRQQDRMNEFSSEFDESLVANRKKWTDKLAVEDAEVGRQSQSFEEYLSNLEKAIAEEGDACRADTASETEPLVDALRQHNERLQQQAITREDRHTEFKKALSAEFSRLRKRLGQEALTRKKQCDETSADVKRSYVELGERLQQQDDKARAWLLVLQTRLDFEKDKRAKSHQSIVDSFTAFMADLERHIGEKQKMSEATCATLVNMQAKLRSNEPP